MEEEPIPFFTPPRELTLEEYKADSNINFYNTVLGLPSLAADTGIDVDPGNDITDLADPSAGSDRDDSDRPDILSMQVFGEGGQYANEPVFQTADTMFSGLSGGTSFDSYSDYLKSTGSTGRLPFVENILDPITQGEMPKFAAQAQASFKEGVEDVKAVPAQSKSVIENLVNTGQISQEQAQDLMKGLLPVAGGLLGAGAAGLIGGETVQNAFGKASFRPAGAMGMMADIVHTIQYRDMAYNRAVTASYLNRSDLMPGAATGDIDLTRVDTGFGMLIGNFGITRKAGSGVYTGNTRGMGIERLKALEAISQGYDPTKGFSVTNPGVGVKVEDSGGSFVSNNMMDGFYRANGTFYDPRTGVSAAMGLERHKLALAAKHGLTEDEVDSVLSGARKGKGALNSLIQSIKDSKAASQPSGDGGGGPTFTTGGKEYEVGTGAGQVDPGLAAGVRESERDNRESDRQGSGQSGSSSRGRVGGGGGGAYSGGSRGQTDSTGGNRRFADGGLIGYAPGGAVAQGGSGFINRPPEQVSEAESVADSQPDAVPEGTFVINAPAVEFAGSDDIRKMLVDAHKEAIRRGITVDKQGNGAKLIDVALSSGEVKVAPHLAKIIGYDRLEKINNRGKAEVEERIQENGQQIVGAATGGLLLGLRQQPQTQLPEGFVQQPSTVDAGPIPSRDEDTFFDYTIGQIKDAIKNVEIKGFEDQPYIFTGIKRKNAPSSAFGPMQITAKTLQDLKDRSSEYKQLSPETQAYVDDLIQQGNDKVNVEKYGSIYRGGKKTSTPKRLKSKLGRYGIGVIPTEVHQQYYDIVADAVLRQKLRDHDNLDAALASYGEGKAYAEKVKKGLR
jgi:hypothetical protein